jgi:hypothetical protein
MSTTHWALAGGGGGGGGRGVSTAHSKMGSKKLFLVDQHVSFLEALMMNMR